LPHYHQKPLPDILSDLFPEVHYVRITRRDKLRQAVSFWKAYQTGVWGRSTRKEDSPTRAAAFDYDRITEVIHMLLQQETGLDEFLARSGVPHFTVVYEEFIDAYEETVRAVLQHVGIQVPKNLVIDAPQTARQADADTEAWVEQYRQIMQERGQNSYSVSGPVP
jgi:LPS sulfotransferase NodH